MSKIKYGDTTGALVDQTGTVWVNGAGWLNPRSGVTMQWTRRQLAVERGPLTDVEGGWIAGGSRAVEPSDIGLVVYASSNSEFYVRTTDGWVNETHSLSEAVAVTWRELVGDGCAVYVLGTYKPIPGVLAVVDGQGREWRRDGELWAGPDGFTTRYYWAALTAGGTVPVAIKERTETVGPEEADQPSVVSTRSTSVTMTVKTTGDVRRWLEATERLGFTDYVLLTKPVDLQILQTLTQDSQE